MESEIIDRRKLLKVKLKALAAEAKIIRFEEKRTKGALRDELCAHRRFAVRTEARATHLAYGFIRGRAYRQIENKCDTPPDWKKVEGMIKRYGKNNRDFEQMKNWAETAHADKAA